MERRGNGKDALVGGIRELLVNVIYEVILTRQAHHIN